MFDPVSLMWPRFVRQSERRKNSCLLVLLFLCAAAPYANAVFNSFVHDDIFQIVQNPYLRDASHVREIFTTSVWSFVGATQSNYYRPVMMLGYLACYQLFGPSAPAFHLINLLLNGLVVWLLFSVTYRMFGRRSTALTAAVIFALHPVHTEAVAWIAAVTELELAFFYLLTFRVFLELEGAGGKRLLWRLALMTASFALALLSKEQAMTLPVVATVYEHFYRADRRQIGWTQKLSRYALLWLLALSYLPMRAYFLGGLAPSIRLAGMTLSQISLSGCALIGQYLGKLLWPFQLHAFYAFQKSTSLWDVGVLLGLLGCGISLVLFRFLWKHSRAASFGIVWIFVTLAPVLNPQWLGTNVFTERYAYLPSMGVCWVAAAGLEYLWVRTRAPDRRRWRMVCVAGIGILAVVCTMRIVVRNRDWRDNVTYYSRIVDGAPNVSGIQDLRLNLGVEYMQYRKMESAEQQFRTILANDPDNLNALNDLAGLLLTVGQPVTAMEMYLRLVRLEPGNALHHMNLGVTYMRLDMLDRAESELQAAVKLAPRSVNAQDNLGQLYWRKGDPVGAERSFRHALAIEPKNIDVRLNLARFYSATSRETDALREYQAALRSDPGNITALRVLRSIPTGK